MEELYIINYSPKSFVVRGDTKKHRIFLKNIGGQYNGYLKDDNNQKFGGWVFPTKDKEKIKKLIDRINIGEVPNTTHFSSSPNSSNEIYNLIIIDKIVGNVNISSFETLNKLIKSLQSSTNMSSPQLNVIEKLNSSSLKTQFEMKIKDARGKYVTRIIIKLTEIK